MLSGRGDVSTPLNLSRQTHCSLRKTAAFRSRTGASRSSGLIRVGVQVQTFNSRMCQLVLGAGAMSVAGLKSITAKHLALSAQGAGAVRALHPVLWAVLTEHVPQSRRALLVPDFARLMQVQLAQCFRLHSTLLCCADHADTRTSSSARCLTVRPQTCLTWVLDPWYDIRERPKWSTGRDGAPQ